VGPGGGYALPFPEANPWKKSKRYRLFTGAGPTAAHVTRFLPERFFRYIGSRFSST